MKRVLPLALVLTAAAGLAAPAQAQTPNQANNGSSAATVLLISSQLKENVTAARPLREGQSVVLVGEITSSPKKVAGVREEQKMQVGVGPAKTDYTLHLGDAPLIGESGRKIEENDLADKMWVRAEGTVMDDPRRIKVTRLQVIGKDLPGLKRSAFYRPGFDQGYVMTMAVAGFRQMFPETPGAVFTPAPLVIVGKVSDDTGALETTRKIQVDAAGNTWTLHVPKDTPIFDAQGKKISVHEVSEGQWVRVHGWQTDDLRMRVARIENIGAEEAFRTSALFREAEPIGYVERVPGTTVRFSPFKVTGVITTIDEREGTLTLRDDQGKDRVIYTETVTVYVNGQPVETKTLRKDQRVTVEGNEIQF
jgi:hypothetical protein